MLVSLTMESVTAARQLMGPRRRRNNAIFLVARTRTRSVAATRSSPYTKTLVFYPSMRPQTLPIWAAGRMMAALAVPSFFVRTSLTQLL